MRNLMTSSMKTRFVAAAAAVVLGAGALTAPAAGAEEPTVAAASLAPVAAAAAGTSAGDHPAGETLTEPDPKIAEQPMTPWLRILEGSSNGPAGAIFAVLFGIISVGMAAYKEFGKYLPTLG